MRHRYVALHSFDSSPAHLRRVAGEGQTLFAPSLSGANGRYLQSVAFDHRFQFVGVYQLRVEDGQFHTIVAIGGDTRHVGLKVAFERHRLELSSVSRENDG